MLGDNSEILALLFIAAMVLLYRRQTTFFTLLKLRLRLSGSETVERAAIPPQTACLLNGAGHELEALGFCHAATHAAPPLSLFDPRAQTYTEYYWHAQESTLALVRLAEPFTGQAASVAFLTLFADGKKLETVNRVLWALMPAGEEYILKDALADNVPDIWNCHLQALAQDGAGRVRASTPDEVLQSERGALARIFAGLREIGWLKEESPGIFHFTFRGAWHMARRQLREVAAARAKLKLPFRHGFEPDAEALRAVELNAFATSLELRAQPLPQAFKAALFGITLLASLLLFGNRLNYVDAAALLAVLLFHEMGHLTAMWAFGFRNLSIFFLPFFGAMASGHKTHVKPWQEAVILLAGPVPGLVLAFGIAQIPLQGLSPDAAEFLRMSFWFALLLNLFNLLPVGILDGGKLFRLAVFSRFPYARALISAVGTAIALIYSVVFGYTVLAAAMAMVLLGAAAQLRGARAISAIRKRARELGLPAQGQSGLGREEAITLLGQYLAQPQFHGPDVKGWARRNGIAAIAYPSLLQGVPRLATVAGVLAAHSLAFIAPLFLAGWIMQHPGYAPLLQETRAAPPKAVVTAQQEQAMRAAREKFMARYAAASDPQQKWALLGQEEDDEDEQPTGLDKDWVKNQRDELFPRLPEDHPAKLRILLEKADAGGTQATDILLTVIAKLTRSDGRTIARLDAGRFFTLNSALRKLEHSAPPEILRAQEALLQAAFEYMEQQPDQRGLWKRSGLADTAAHLAYAAGNPARAEEWMARKALYDNKMREKNGDPALPSLDQAWFQLELGHAEQAAAMAANALQDHSLPDYTRGPWLTLAGWADMSRGRPREADAWFMQRLEPLPAERRDWKDDFNVTVWLMRLINGQPLRSAPRLNHIMFDHLAALEAYDPQEAAHYRAELAPRLTPEWKKYLKWMAENDYEGGGWGSQRRAAVSKILAGM